MNDVDLNSCGLSSLFFCSNLHENNSVTYYFDFLVLLDWCNLNLLFFEISNQNLSFSCAFHCSKFNIFAMFSQLVAPVHCNALAFTG